MDTQDRLLLNAICDLGSFTSAQLAQRLHISERSARERLKRVEEDLQCNGGSLTSKSGKGYAFRIVDKDRFSAWLSSVNSAGGIPSTSQGRADYILNALLQAENFLKLDDLCDELYISRTTMTADMKQVKSVLQRYHLSLVQRSGQGIRIEGNELELRNCMAYNLLRKERGSGETKWIVDDKRQVVDSMARAFKAQNLTLSKQSFLELLHYITVAAERIQSGHYIVFDEERMKRIGESISPDIFSAADMIVRDILHGADDGGVVWERAGLALLIRGKGVFRQDPPQSKANPAQGQLEQLARDMLELVFEMYGMDFRSDEELLTALTQHMVSFDARMRYNLILTNPILEQIRKEYSAAYHLAASACIVLQRAYGQPIPDAEIGYFAILFALADQRKGRDARKNVLIVCVSGQATSRLFMHRFQSAFGAYVNHVYTCSAFQLSSFDFVGRKINAVFTTVSLDLKLPVPVFQVSLLLTEQEIHAFQQILRSGHRDILFQYFRESLFCGKIAAESKEAALRIMCQAIEKEINLPEDFYQCVLRREEMGQTDFGNLVAIPHPCRIMGTEKFVSVAVLEQPVWWGHHDVQVILLVSLEQDDPDAERFFEIVSDFMGSPHAVKKLIRTPTYQTLTEVLNRSR